MSDLDSDNPSAHIKRQTTAAQFCHQLRAIAGTSHAIELFPW